MRTAPPMRIAKVETTVVEIPFHEPGKNEGILSSAWRSLETVLVRVEDEDGFVGWGEGFGYFCADATRTVIDQRIAPLAVGREIDDVRAWTLEVQLGVHLFGRYGITLFAIGGVDMALWDLKAKRAGVSLARLLRPEGPLQTSAEAYASLVRYDQPDLVAEVSRRALAEGYRELKLHEVVVSQVRASREAVGDGIPISVDVNCKWDEAGSLAAIPQLAELGVSWLEEPIFPPEDFGTLGRLRGHGLPIGAGENWFTRWQFQQAVQAGAVDLLQPSLTKIGGLHEYLEVVRMAEAAGQRLVPHCPYYGPGYHATLQLAAAFPVIGPIEVLYVDREAKLAASEPGLLPSGRLSLPQEVLGIGFEPDLDVVHRYRRG